MNVAATVQRTAIIGFLSWLFVCVPAVHAIDPSSLQKGAYTNLSFTTSDGKLLYYQIYVPATYSPSAHLPLLIGMHGGSSGTPGSLSQTYDALTFLQSNPNWKESTYPCAILEPFCNPDWCGQPKFVPGYPCWDGFGWAYGTPAHVHDLSNPPAGIAYVCELIPVLEKDLGLDSLRCYATGWSNGAYATWDLLMLHPDLFAAGVAISGAGDTSHAYRFVNIPVWAFHSDNDDVVPYSGSVTMIAKLKALGGNPKFTNTSGAAHFAYAPAWQTPDLVPWLFSQSKGNTAIVDRARTVESPRTHLVVRSILSRSSKMETRVLLRVPSGSAQSRIYDLHGRELQQASYRE